MGVRQRQTAKEFFRIRKKLAVGHLLGHIKQKPAVAIVNAAKQPAEAAQEPRLFPLTSPRDIVGSLPLLSLIHI